MSAMDVDKSGFHSPKKQSNSLFKRNNSIRSSKKKAQLQTQMISTQKSTGMKVALIILNQKYSTYSPLPGVTADGNLMMKMLATYNEVVVLKDESNIEQAVKEFCEKHRDSFVECLHFHYSGHGVENATVEIDPHSYKKEDDKKTFVGVTPTGGCMVGCGGELYSVHDLKIELLNCNPARVTLTLDCCRNRDRGGDCKEFVTLRHKKKISTSDQLKIAVIHGTSDLHTASDANSFTKELYKIFEIEGGEVQILHIVRKVNKSWKERGIYDQICKHDIIEDGTNWIFYMWPTSHTFKLSKQHNAGVIMTDTDETDRQEDFGEMLGNVIQKLATLEFEKEADRKILKNLVDENQKLKTEVSELHDHQETRRRKIAKVANPSRKLNTHNEI